MVDLSPEERERLRKEYETTTKAIGRYDKIKRLSHVWDKALIVIGAGAIVIGIFSWNIFTCIMGAVALSVGIAKLIK